MADSFLVTLHGINVTLPDGRRLFTDLPTADTSTRAP